MVKWHIILFIVLILLGILLYSTRSSSSYEGFMDSPTTSDSQIETYIGQLEREIQMAPDIEQKLIEIETILMQPTLNNDQLARLDTLYNDYNNYVNEYRTVVNHIDSATPTRQLGQLGSLFTLLTKAKESLARNTEIQHRIQEKLGKLGYNIVITNSGTAVKILPIESAPATTAILVPGTTPVSTTTNIPPSTQQTDTSITVNTDLKRCADKMMSEIRKLQEINEENINYYKKLNVDQQTILLQIINKRNDEIKLLQSQLASLFEILNRTASGNCDKTPSVFPIPTQPTPDNNVSIFPPIQQIQPVSSNTDTAAKGILPIQIQPAQPIQPPQQVQIQLLEPTQKPTQPVQIQPVQGTEPQRQIQPQPLAQPNQTTIIIPQIVRDDFRSRQPPYMGPSPYPSQCCATNCCGKPGKTSSPVNISSTVEPHRDGRTYKYPYPYDREDALYPSYAFES